MTYVGFDKKEMPNVEDLMQAAAYLEGTGVGFATVGQDSRLTVKDGKFTLYQFGQKRAEGDYRDSTATKSGHINWGLLSTGVSLDFYARKGREAAEARTAKHDMFDHDFVPEGA